MVNIKCFSWNVADNDNYGELTSNLIIEHLPKTGPNPDVIVVHLQETGLFNKEIVVPNYQIVYYDVLNGAPGFSLRSYILKLENSKVTITNPHTSITRHFYKSFIPTKGYIGVELTIDNEQMTFINIHNFAPSNYEKEKELSTNLLQMEILKQKCEEILKLKKAPDTNIASTFEKIDNPRIKTLLVNLEQNLHNPLNFHTECPKLIGQIIQEIDMSILDIKEKLNKKTFKESILRQLAKDTDSDKQYILFGDLNSRNLPETCSVDSFKKVYTKKQIEGCSYNKSLNNDYLVQNLGNFLPNWKLLDDTKNLTPTYKVVRYTEESLVFEEGTSKHPISFPDRAVAKTKNLSYTNTIALPNWLHKVSKEKCNANTKCKPDNNLESEIKLYEEKYLVEKNKKEIKKKLKELYKKKSNRPVSDHIPITFSISLKPVSILKETEQSFKQKYLQAKFYYKMLLEK